MSDDEHGCPECGSRDVQIIPVHNGSAGNTLAGVYHIDTGEFVFDTECQDCGWEDDRRRLQTEVVER